ncbi:Uncharacterised protein [Yersinia intermedia]|nr:Uncharacterised protein [Yersinia intermedia]
MRQKNVYETQVYSGLGRARYGEDLTEQSFL